MSLLALGYYALSYGLARHLGLARIFLDAASQVPQRDLAKTSLFATFLVLFDFLFCSLFYAFTLEPESDFFLFLFLPTGIAAVLIQPESCRHLKRLLPIASRDSALKLLQRLSLLLSWSPQALVLSLVIGFVALCALAAVLLFTYLYGARLRTMTELGFSVLTIRGAALLMMSLLSVKVVESFRQSFDLYMNLVEGLPIAMWRKDSRGCFVYMNRHLRQLLNVNVTESLATSTEYTDYSFFPKELADKYRNDDAALLDGTRSELVATETFQVPSKGSLTIRVTKMPVFDLFHHIVGTQGLFIDVSATAATERRLRQEVDQRTSELNAANLRYQSIFDHSVIGICRSRLDGSGFLLVNNALAAMYGYGSADEMVNEVQSIPRQLYVDPSVRERLVSQVRVSTHVMGYTAEVYSKDKERRFVISQDVSLVRDPLSGEEFLDAAVRDITKEQQLTVVIRGFTHMIPGKADEVAAGLELASGGCDHSESMEKALCFIFMIRHKSDEVRSLMQDEFYFPGYSIAQALSCSWPVAIDFARVSCNDLRVVYDHGASPDTQINGAFYTAAVNLLCNSRTHGTPPFVVWVFIDCNTFTAVFADGGPKQEHCNGVQGHATGSKQRRGIGLVLVTLILKRVNGFCQQVTVADLEREYDHLPAELTRCKTFYRVCLPLNS